MTSTKLPAIVQRLAGLISSGRAMSWAMLDQFLVKGAMFAFGLLAARAIGLEGFGRFTLVLVVLYLLQELHAVFVTSPMMTIVGTRSRGRAYFAALSRLNLAVSVLSGVAVALCVMVLFTLRDGHTPFGLAVAAGAATLTNSYQVGLRRILFAQHRESEAFKLDLAYFVILLGVVSLGLFAIEWTGELLLWLMAASSLITILPHWTSAFRGPSPWRMMRGLVARHWQMSRWLLSTAVVAIGQEQAIWIIMGFVLGDTAVGSVRVGQYLYGLIAIPLTAMHNYVVRQAAQAFAIGRERGLISYLWRETLTLGSIIATLLALVVIPGGLWLEVLFRVSDETTLLILHAFAGIYIAIFLRDLWIFYLQTVNRTQDVFLAMTASSVLAAAIAYPMTLWFGALGAVGVLAIAHLLSMTLVLFTVIRHFTAAGSAQRSPAHFTSIPPVAR